jgi:multidrug efflux pump subunit AcrA (membrane-fusion protein)
MAQQLGSYSDALDLVRPSRFDRVVTLTLSIGFAIMVLVLWLTPWQQTAPGYGSVVAYAPQERRQTIEAPIEGRVALWHVREGAQVRKGDALVDLVDNDPQLVTRLEAERSAAVARIDAARARERAIAQRMEALQGSGRSGLSAAESRVRMAAQRVRAAEQAVALGSAALKTARLNMQRQQVLSGQGLASRRNFELAELEVTRCQTDLDRAEAALVGARSEQLALGEDRSKLGNDINAGLSDAEAARSTALAEIASATAELARVEVRLSRQATQSITAPTDGAVLRIIANGRTGDVVKAGDVLAVLVPATNDRAAVVYVSGNDVPLISDGASVRLQFEGWPALQFSGWPQVAVGTFPGRVKVLDASDDEQGRFRILVVPEQELDWPPAKFLRQGVRVNAWVQLGRVSLGYELWRLFNGFPASLPDAPSGEAKASFSTKSEGATK